jgi:phosphatidylglycerol lysyltransferase
MGLTAISVIAAFSLALGAGMVGGTPGGIGPFELALAALLPLADHATLAAALIGFRLVYYALPCALGATYAFVARPLRQKNKMPAPGTLKGSRAEHPIAAQSLTRQICSVDGAPPAEACALRSPQTLTLFLGATKGRVTDLLTPLKQAANQENRIPCLYKLDARDAARLRQAGWAVRPFAVDAILNPQTFDLQGSERRQLRRALRKAEKSGLRIARIDTPDWADMEAIHRAWEAPHGNERGFTMGRFCPLYLGDKHLYGAWEGDRLIAYCSAVDGDDERALDLMRHYPELPQGTMHALITFMIEDAKHAGITQFSLAALPHPSLPARLADCAGLTRFKTCFAPRWKPLYIAAPNHALLLLAALDIRQAILLPNPLPLATVDHWHADSLIDRAVKPATRLLRRAS